MKKYNLIEFILLSTCFILVLTFFSCKDSPKEIQFETYLSALGKNPDYITSIIDQSKWEYMPDVIGDSGYYKSYTYSEKGFPMHYIRIDKCNENDGICEVAYSISKDDYLNKIPSELKRLNFESLDDDPKTDTLHSEYIKSKTFDINVILGKYCNEQNCRYSVRIRSLELPDSLKQRIKQH